MGNKSKVQTQGGDTLTVTIPKAIGQSMSLKKGSIVEFAYAYGEIVIRLSKD